MEFPLTIEQMREYAQERLDESVGRGHLENDCPIANALQVVHHYPASISLSASRYHGPDGPVDIDLPEWAEYLVGLVDEAVGPGEHLDGRDVIALLDQIEADNQTA